MKRQTLFTILRAAISIAIIGFLLGSADLPALMANISTANWWWLLAALALQVGCLLISTYRWQLLLSAQNMRYPFAPLISFNMVGRFFNIFLPTSTGGDIVRIYEMAKHSQRAADSIISVLADRVLGTIAMFVICWVSLAATGWRLLEGTDILLIIALLSLAFILVLAALLNPRLMRGIIALTHTIKLWNLESRLITIYSSLQEMVKFKKALAYVFWISLLIQLIFIISVYFTALAVNIHVPALFFLIVMPLISVIVLLPISIGGLGVREGAFVFFFSQQGVSTASALSLSLLFFSQALIIALAGGVIYAVGRYRRDLHNNSS